MENSNISSIDGGLFGRDGHLTELSLDRFEAGELAMNLHECVVDHVDLCPTCADRMQDLQGLDLRLQPPRVVSATPNRFAAGLLGIVATVVAAAALLLILWPPQPQHAAREPAAEGWMASSYTSTSAEFDIASVTGGADISVLAEGADGEPTVELEDKARVGAYEPVHVRLRARDPHYAAVVVVSAADGADADDGTGGAEAEAELEVLMTPARVAQGVTRHVTLEPDPGQRETEIEQRITVIMCRERFSILSVDDLDERASTPGCRSFELDLTRFAEVANCNGIGCSGVASAG